LGEEAYYFGVPVILCPVMAGKLQFFFLPQ
jgi:hypothetical protein